MQQTIQLRQVAQPSLSQILEIAKMSALIWLNARSNTFSAIAGETVSHRDVVMAHAYLGIVFVIGIIVSLMGGGNSMSLTYHEYMNEVQQLDARIRENKKKSVELLQQRDAQRVTALKKLEADFHSQKNRLYEECRDDCHKIREQYQAERHQMYLQRETLVYEWRKKHPIPTRVIRKAYELMGMNPNDFLTEAADDLQSAAAFITPPMAIQEEKGGEV